ncbi:unnamed protein product [Miscanthus lutarioriparius]|uniref:Serpin domain-containing protein n=1 Tax=Miscanthus lutarioriparius TaxID=422564 RepID=A0A811PPI3_9POAL|nr:unnamed protein product [Miscanthus lutarioriparius]
MEEAAAARPSKKARGTAASGLTAFGLRLAKYLADADEGAGVVGVEGQNIFFSPLSIYAALALLSAGARCTTVDELLAALGAASLDEIAEFVSAVVERALADHSESEDVTLKPAYTAAAVESYKAETHAADFMNKGEEAREKINRWVSKATKNLITSILPKGSVRSDTALVLANAIYFKGSWSIPFAEEDTKIRRFQRLDGSHVRTPFMRSWKDHAVAEYKGFSMCVFLPDAHDGLPNLMDMMASRPNFLWDHMPRERIEVDELRLPKFKLSFSSRINGVLKAMGIKAAFEEGTADLSDMLEGGADLVLEHVFHKAVIEVNEEGTEAAASTACTMVDYCLYSPVNFVADHPFAFFVVEEVSGVVVFMGHVLNPTKSEHEE